jgi:DNA-directed RNA polymerase specialized sigma24 family protein
MFVNGSEFGGTTRSRAHADCGGIYGSNEQNILFRLAYLITGDEVQAEDSVIAAYDLAGQGQTPFREWLLEWTKCATVRSAIEARLADIRECEIRYKSSDCRQPRHRPPVMRPDLPAMTESILLLDPEVVITELDSLARAILVLRGVLGASVRDCSGQLNVFSESVLAAERRIMAWLAKARGKQLPDLAV